MVVDEAHERLFLTGTEDDRSLLVANYDGEIVERVAGVEGGAFMELAGDRLYISVVETRRIHELDTETLQVLRTFDTGEDVYPAYLAKVGNYLWFSFDCGDGGNLGSIELTSGFVQVFEGASDYPGCHGLRAVPGNDTQLFTFDPRADSQLVPITALDVAAGRVLRERGTVPGGGDIRFVAGGESFVTCLGGRVQRYQTSDLAALEQIALPCVTGLDQSADGTVVATGAGPSVRVLRTGSKTSVWKGWPFYSVARAVRITPDGTRLFAVTYDSNAARTGFNLNTFVPTREVRATKAYEYLPGGAAHYVMWTEIRRGATRIDYPLLVKRDGQPPFRVNPRGTQGFAGGIDDSQLVYQQRRGLRSDIVFFNLQTGRRWRPGNRVNTRGWEYSPSLSKPWLLFARANLRFTDRRILLANLKTGRVVTLDRMRGRDPYLVNGQVNGDFATWSKCTNRCDIFRYDIKHKKELRLPNPRVEDSFGPSVTSDGTVYFGRGAGRCGHNIRLMKYQDGKTSVVMDFPPGRDFYTSTAYEAESGGTNLYLDALSCPGPGGRLKSDIWGVEGL